MRRDRGAQTEMQISYLVPRPCVADGETPGACAPRRRARMAFAASAAAAAAREPLQRPRRPRRGRRQPSLRQRRTRSRPCPPRWSRRAAVAVAGRGVRVIWDPMPAERPPRLTTMRARVDLPALPPRPVWLLPPRAAPRRPLAAPSAPEAARSRHLPQASGGFPDLLRRGRRLSASTVGQRRRIGGAPCGLLQLAALVW